MTSAPANSVFEAWGRGKSALLYGPPGTGKTRILSEILRELNASTAPVSQLGLDASDPANSFKPVDAISSSAAATLPQPVMPVWLTFHQSMTYEDFVIGLRPENQEDFITLVPHAGVLLDAVVELQQGSGAQSVVIFIDEINRGNAAKIFGEFLTFLDFDYRETLRDGSENPSRLPLPIRHLSHSDSQYSPMVRADGSTAQLEYPSYFPRHIYVVATMNSVDRTAIPIDSALARRFDRIDVRPDLGYLAEAWGVELTTLGEKAGTPSALNTVETSILLIDRLNLALAENFGTDFELGHGLLAGLADPDDWSGLSRIWDQVLFPQLEDRFSGRTEELANTLRVEEFASTPYAWRFRSSLGGDNSASVLAPVSLSDIDPDLARSSLQLLASRSLGK